jgi:hypothetical protein
MKVSQFDDGVPHAPRVFNHWFGGTYNGPTDRAPADDWRRREPGWSPRHDTPGDS